MIETTGASTTSPALIKSATDIRQVRAAVSARFDVLDLTGVFETAAMYLARDKKNPDLLVTLRLICGEALRDPKQVELFCLEAEAASRLKHRNIVRASKATSADGFHFMAVEHRAGAESLRSLLDRRGWLEPELVVKIVCQIADALNYAHSLGVLHLNLHPDNLLIDRDGNVLITGFGIGGEDELDWAHAERSRRMPVRYISPEQARGDRLGHQSDLYSLGITLFEMLTDRLPFNAANSEVIKRKHITQTPLPPYIFSPGVSQPLSEITMKLLDKRPSGRFRDGAALISILRRIYDISPVAAARPAATARRIESPAPEAEQAYKADDEAVDKAAGAVEEETVSMAGISQEAALAEEEAMPEPDQAEAPPEEPENRMHYESPVISVIDHPVQQFYETASSPEAASTASVPLFKEAAGRTSPARPRSRWRRLFIIAAIPLVAGVIALARFNYLPNIFRTNMTESVPAQNFQPSPDSSQPAAAAKTEGEPAGSSPQSEPPPPGPQDGVPPAGQADTPAASQGATPAAPRVRKAQVRKSVRRSKPKPKRYRAKRRWF
jgi:hypothetical protein